MSGTSVSGATASAGAGQPQAGSGTAGPGRRGLRVTSVAVAIAAATLLALGLRLYLLSRPGYLLSLTEYDDGPYFGSAVRLVNGAVPYRDFLVVQPPGITLLMVPAALGGKLVGTGWAMAAGRLMTAVAGAAGVLLAGLLVRHRGLLAVVVTCGICAVFPDGVRAAHTVLVEPWLVLFCLAGAVAVFDGDRLTTSRRRLALGGLAFGFAGAVEIWAIFPVVVIALLALARAGRVRRLAVYLAGVAVGFLVPVLPFAVVAPRGMYQGLVTAQIGGRAGAMHLSNVYRLKEMTGLSDVTGNWHLYALAGAVVIAAFVLGSLGLASAVRRRPPPALDLFAVGSIAIIAAAFMWPNQFHYHFAAFSAPFLAMAVALPASGLVEGTGPGAPGARPLPVWLRWLAAGLVGVVILGMAGVQARWDRVQKPHMALSAIDSARRLVPAGACLVTDEVSVAILADRFVSDVPGCPLLVDSIGTDYALSHGRDPQTGAARFPRLVAVWQYSFGHAQYVWLSGRQKHRIPWTPRLRAYFSAHFTEIYRDGHVGVLYRRDGLGG